MYRRSINLTAGVKHAPCGKCGTEKVTVREVGRVTTYCPKCNKV
jgi:formamidopyrimidine-DNA glycosylase